MIDAVNAPVQTVASQGVVLFGSTRISTGCSVRHEQGSGRFVATKPGIYKVSFNANVAIPAGGTIAPITLNILQDGDPLAGTQMIATPAAAGDLYNVSATTLVKVYQCCGCTSIGVQNSGVASIEVQDANFVITREC